MDGDRRRKRRVDRSRSRWNTLPLKELSQANSFRDTFPIRGKHRTRDCSSWPSAVGGEQAADHQEARMIDRSVAVGTLGYGRAPLHSHPQWQQYLCIVCFPTDSE